MLIVFAKHVARESKEEIFVFAKAFPSAYLPRYRI